MISVFITSLILIHHINVFLLGYNSYILTTKIKNLCERLLGFLFRTFYGFFTCYQSESSFFSNLELPLLQVDIIGIYSSIYNYSKECTVESKRITVFIRPTVFSLFSIWVKSKQRLFNHR